MIENIWENTNQKTIVKQQLNNFLPSSNNFSSTLEHSLKENKQHYPTPKDSDYGPSFTNTQIADKDIPNIITKLKQQPLSTALFLAKNNISDLGVKKLAQQIKNNQYIKHLILSQNNICLNEFCKAALMDLLKINHYIGWLVLNGNNICDTGAKNLSAALKENKGIIHLILSDNNITDTGLEALLKSLENHPKLNSIFIDQNKLTKNCIPLLECFVKQSTTLKTISLKGINITHPDQLIKLEFLCKQKRIKVYF